MKIFCKAANTTQLPASAIVKKVGKYLYKHIDGAFDQKSTSNMYDVYFMLLYQLPRLKQVPGRQKEGYNDMKEMHINLNVTTYQNKIRVNVIEITPEERTLGFDLYKPELFENMEEAKACILSKVQRRIQKAYSEYDFLF